MEFMSAREASNLWGISQRRVAVLCSENRISGAKFLGNMWLIPQNASKPDDGRTHRNIKVNNGEAKPFLKWAGGKGQLLKEISFYYPFNEQIKKYAEPFVGGGAVLFDILNKYELEEIYISDVNAELINTYQVIRNNVDDLLERLLKYQNEYLPLATEKRKIYYLAKRDRFNELKFLKTDNKIEKAALTIFLNKTCFNGLYRVNRKGLFNVPIGAYKNPCICDCDNLRNVSRRMQNVNIILGDYKQAAGFIDNATFAYFDPPYRPINTTSSFTSYTENSFDDEHQVELSVFVREMAERGAKVVVSNSDPKNINENDDFFDDIYADLQIKRVEATRMINSKSSKRGKIKELLISNY